MHTNLAAEHPSTMSTFVCVNGSFSGNDCGCGVCDGRQEILSGGHDYANAIFVGGHDLMENITK